MNKQPRLSPEDWQDVGDLIEQCISLADMDESYSRRVRDVAVAMLKRAQNKAVDRGMNFPLDTKPLT